MIFLITPCRLVLIVMSICHVHWLLWHNHSLLALVGHTLCGCFLFCESGFCSSKYHLIWRLRSLLIGSHLPCTEISGRYTSRAHTGSQRPRTSFGSLGSLRWAFRGVIQALRAAIQAPVRLLEASEATNRLLKFHKSLAPPSLLPHQ